MLEAVGIDGFAEQVYRALLQNPESSLADLSLAVAAAPRNVSRALSRLAGLGLIRRPDGKRYIPVSPEAAIGMLIHQRRAALDEVRGAVSELVDEFRLRALQSHPAGLIEVITGAEAVRKRSVELQYSPEKSIMSFDKPPYATPPTGYDEIGTERPLLDRGVEMRIIYDNGALQLPGRLDTITELVRLGEKARTLSTLPLKLYIYDHRLAIIPLTGSHTSEAMAIVHPSALLDALVALFEAYWDRAQPIASAPAGADEDLSPQEAQVLTMLSAGLTDQAIARQLGVSLRTARRRVTGVMDRVHASTRFQAGVAAAHRGWV
jgi:DNA-binding CsgD family transcriptional regulator/DNA-binding transcriptional ArsR family regulator